MSEAILKNIVIREIKVEDAENYLKLLIKVDHETKNMMYEPGERKTTVAEIRQRIESYLTEDSLCIVAEEHNELIGYLVAERGFAKRIRHSAYLFTGIREGYRGQGLGKRLFAEFEKWAERQKLVRAELTVMTHNAGGIKLYESMGFSIEGEKRKSMIVDGEFVDEYYMGRIFPWAEQKNEAENKQKKEKILLHTERLLLKGLEEKDGAALFSYRKLPEVYEFQGWMPKSEVEAKEFITEKIAKEWNIPDTWFQLGIYKKDTGELIGDFGVHFIDAEGAQVEIGFTLNPAFQGKGFGLEAAKGVLEYLFTDMNKHRVIASVDPKNYKSIALIEGLGMRKEAHFIESYPAENGWADDLVFGILNREWKTKAAK